MSNATKIITGILYTLAVIVGTIIFCYVSGLGTRLDSRKIVALESALSESRKRNSDLERIIADAGISIEAIEGIDGITANHYRSLRAENNRLRNVVDEQASRIDELEAANRESRAIVEGIIRSIGASVDDIDELIRIYSGNPAAEDHN